MAFMKKRLLLCGLMIMGVQFSVSSQGNAQESINITLDSAVDIAMGTSYRIKQLEMGIERNRYYLVSRQAGLKSRVYMNLRAPQIEAVSDFMWNSTLQKDEIVQQNTRLWQMDLSVRQPVILLGYPTNGYLSLNNKMYRYLQKDGYDDVSYYNRYYLRFEQPFFLPNTLKNDIEDAELDLERRELEYIRDRVRLIDDVAGDYYDLYEVTYQNIIFRRRVENLEKVVEIARAKALEDSTSQIESFQAQVELANANEMLMKNQSAIRNESMRMKQRLRIDQSDSVNVSPVMKITPVTVDLEQAVQYGYSLSPNLRMLSIDKRQREIGVNDAEGWDAFNVRLEMTYGLENEEDRHQQMWENYDNSYSVSLNAYVPIWDWGRRKARIEAEKINLKQTELSIEENQDNIRNNITIAVKNLLEYQQRTVNLQSSANMVQDITDMSLEQYQEGRISVQDILQIINRQRETELNFLDAYLGYRNSLLSLMIQTYYDYENDISLIVKFRPQS